MAYIYGRNPLLEALKSGKEIEKIYVKSGQKKGSIKEILDLAGKRKIQVRETSQKDLDRMSRGENNQGVLALVSDFSYSSTEDILDLADERGEDPFILMLDRIEDPHNLGAIIRTAEAAGVHGIIIPERRAAQVTGLVEKVSSGALSYMRIARVKNLSRTLRDLKDRGLWVYAATVDGEEAYYQRDFSGPVLLLLGNEGKGIGDNLIREADFKLRIPMYGEVSSLNVSNAAAILIFEVAKGRHGQE